MARKPPPGALLGCILLAAACGCGDASERTARPARYTSLTLAAEVARGAVIEVWKGAGDRRITLVQQAPEPLRVGPIPAGEDCTLRFGVAFDRERPPVGPIPLAIRAGSTVLFREEVDPTGARWTNREVALPPVDEITLVFEADVSETTPVGWGSPRVVCATGGTVFPPRADQPHIVVISIDTLRADHLGVYGYGRPTSPQLDAFAREATVFDLAFATSPWTLPSHASLLTGLYPEEHRAGHANVFAPLASEVPTVAEILSNSGYRTIAHTGAGYVGRRYGLQRGFEQWTERSFASLDSAVWEVLDQLDDDLDRPFLLFLHTYSTHAPYLHPSTVPSLRDEEAAWPPESDPERRRWLALGNARLHRHL
ncbi:MAG: sulfatase-like hydrolase/transferase, partial [Myxococcota bacterium]